MKKHLFFFGISCSLLGGLLGFSGCTQDPDCESSYTDHVYVSFYIRDASDTPTLQKLAFDQVLAKEKSRPLYTNEDLISVFRLPIHPTQSSTAFLFCKEDVCQEIVFEHEQQLHLIGEDCPAEVRITLLNITTHDFSDASIVASELSKNHAMHVRIFL